MPWGIPTVTWIAVSHLIIIQTQFWVLYYSTFIHILRLACNQIVIKKANGRNRWTNVSIGIMFPAWQTPLEHCSEQKSIMSSQPTLHNPEYSGYQTEQQKQWAAHTTDLIPFSLIFSLQYTFPCMLHHLQMASRTKSYNWLKSKKLLAIKTKNSRKSSIL